MSLKSIEAEVMKEFDELNFVDAGPSEIYGIDYDKLEAFIRTLPRRIALEVVREVKPENPYGTNSVEEEIARIAFGRCRQAMQERADAFIGDETV